MIRRIRATPSEGLPALWKGQVVATVHAVLSTVLQPSIHAILYTAVPSSGTSLPLDFPLTALPHPVVPLAIQVASHAVTQFLISPLEMLRTRLIVIPANLPSTPSSLTLLRRAITEEGGIAGLYLHANLLIPTLLEHTIRPLMTLSIPLIIERYFGISPDLAPISYSMADLGLNIAAILVILPIETVRRRLQLQSRSDGESKKIRSVVRLRERDYIGVVEAMWRIVTEETSAPRKRRMSEKDEGGWLSGVGQLYRGVSGKWNFGRKKTQHADVYSSAWLSRPTLQCLASVSSAQVWEAAVESTAPGGRRSNIVYAWGIHVHYKRAATSPGGRARRYRAYVHPRGDR
jgi:fusion and transport protein UGO1